MLKFILPVALIVGFALPATRKQADKQLTVSVKRSERS
jgi:hypothetical protein